MGYKYIFSEIQFLTLRFSSSGLMSVLQFGHRNRLVSQFSRQSTWKVWPHTGITLTDSFFMKSLRQIEQLLYLKVSSDFPFFEFFLATDEQIKVSFFSSDHYWFFAFFVFSVLFESWLDIDVTLLLLANPLELELSKDSRTYASKSSS